MQDAAGPAEDADVTADPAPEAGADLAEQLRATRALLAATFRLSQTGGTCEAADVLADVACEVTAADGAHLYVPDQLGSPVWSNANTRRSAAPRGALRFDAPRDVPELAAALEHGEDVFVVEGLRESAWRAVGAGPGKASLLLLPLLDVGVLVLWWSQRLEAPPALSADVRSFLRQGAEALRRRLEATTLRDLAVKDPLTGLVNRRALMAALAGLPAHGALLLMDLDHFKRVNDTHGHRHGDQVLRAFADLLRGHEPEGGCVARWGGEEFAVVLPVDGRRAGTRLFSQLRALWGETPTTFSAGLAEHRAGSTAEETFEAADRALYVAKGTGRDRLVHAPDVAWELTAEAPALPHPRRPASIEAGLTLSELDEALERGLVLPHYQPVVETVTGGVVAVEALARLCHPRTGALLLPERFLPLAERTGRIRRVDSLVASAAIAAAAQWRREGYDIAVGVNVSVDHLDDPQLPGRLLDECRAQGLDYDALVVEVTETLQSLTGRGHAAAMQHLRDAGVNVTLDDFGTGFSTLSYLLRFPAAGLKIDRSFTAALDTARGRQLVLGILDIGASLDVHIVAEGVEEVAQLRWLSQHGCPFAQGYLISPPVPAERVTDVIDELDRSRRLLRTS